MPRKSKDERMVVMGRAGGSVSSSKKTQANRFKAAKFWEDVREGKVDAPKKGGRKGYRKIVLRKNRSAYCHRPEGDTQFFVYDVLSCLGMGKTPALAWKSAAGK